MKNNIVQRILAMLTLVVLTLCLILTLILAFMGSKYFLVMLFITLAAPVFLWICMFFYKQGKDRSNES